LHEPGLTSVGVPGPLRNEAEFQQRISEPLNSPKFGGARSANAHCWEILPQNVFQLSNAFLSVPAGKSFHV
jgi:hypothetical protein